MRYIAIVNFDRHPIRDNGEVNYDRIETSMRSEDNIEAMSNDEAWVTAMVRLRANEPNLVKVNTMKVEQYHWPQE